MPLLSAEKLGTVIVVSLIAGAFLLARHLLVPGVERFAAAQRHNDENIAFIERQVERLAAENTALQQRLTESEKQRWDLQSQSHADKNRMQVLIFSYEHALGILKRFRELCMNEPITGNTVVALREISRESAALRMTRDILSNTGN